jgi:serine/threonine-protein kinase
VRARDLVLGCDVALKTLRVANVAKASSAMRFRREARIAARLQHPGTVAVHDLGDLPDGRPFYTMAEVRGRSFGELILETWARAPTGLPHAAELRPLIEVLRAACHTMAYVHSRGVVHLDLKPANLMIGAWNDVLVVDWGIAWCRDDPDPTLRGAGSQGYAPPEQVRGEEVAFSPKADVYALGAILSAVLTGRAPGEAALPPEAPEDLRALAQACLREDPALRPRGAAEVFGGSPQLPLRRAHRSRAAAHARRSVRDFIPVRRAGLPPTA